MIVGVGATRVGVISHQHYTGKRRCYRCGIDKHTNGRTDSRKPFMCGDCKVVDRAMAIRLGIISA